MYIYRALRKAQTITYFSNKKKLVINAIPLRTTLFLIHSEILRLTVQHTNNVNVHPCVFSSFSGHLHVCHHSCLTCTVSCCSADRFSFTRVITEHFTRFLSAVKASQCDVRLQTSLHFHAAGSHPVSCSRLPYHFNLIFLQHPHY